MSKKYLLFFIMILCVGLAACGNDSATQDNTRNFNISSTSTNSPSTDLTKKQTPVQQEQGSGNNFRPISMQSGEGNQPPTQNQGEQLSPNRQNQNQDVALTEFEQEVVRLTNQERRRAGLSNLEVDSTLSGVAREKSKDMQANNYFSHTSPTYGSPFDMMAQYGVTYRQAGENIARGQNSPEEVVRAWMNSEGHRANILKGGYTHIGVGYVQDGNYWTQMFIQK
ncbi:CAP domain-containing protein [Oceanobacillus bengalensis]|uniref:SCP-like extracellular protein n=1 Tax=Oceanobacillus bengalensis TaxID=1435466 RepID=A0A494Z3L8_9BACI|nr:CAP domain-containing protein [Oceanobacillus bengalensis]RKQ16609.1 SCP-like extracellular protein [Oceanobacillus bengalensis]